MKKKKTLREHLEGWIWTIVIVLLLRESVIQAYLIPSSSMEDTLLAGDFVLATKFDFGLRVPFTDIKMFSGKLPKRGDIVIFSYPLEKNKDFVKRVIGLPGDTIEIRNKVLYVNHKKLVETYATYKDTHTYPSLDLSSEDFMKLWLEGKFSNGQRFVRDNFGPIVVPDGKVFVLGDNRDYSFDSRFWGPLDIRYLKGKPRIIYFSWGNGIRLERLFKIIVGYNGY
ncbi:MAG: signal peptidase I [candidate division WOR-3 bacterium]|nr:signal peptidase I [candidate division WOR-3 bacterium]MDW8150535.1 signal peptidase I [candidate division WOR-3 bacterium]